MKQTLFTIELVCWEEFIDLEEAIFEKIRKLSLPDDFGKIVIEVKRITGDDTDEWEKIQKRLNKLDALEAFGVDNWRGYADAMYYMDTGELP